MRRQGPVSIKPVFPRYRIPMLKIRRSRDRLIFNVGIPKLVRRHLYIETAPRSPSAMILSVRWRTTCDSSMLSNGKKFKYNLCFFTYIQHVKITIVKWLYHNRVRYRFDIIMTLLLWYVLRFMVCLLFPWRASYHPTLFLYLSYHRHFLITFFQLHPPYIAVYEGLG